MTSGAGRDKPSAVLDSNVLISGFAFPSGTPYRILQALIRAEFAGIISPFILEEVARNLRRIGVSEAVIDESVELLSEKCEVIEPPRLSEISTLTEADNRILDCAIAALADYLVTGDKGILAIGAHEGTRVVSPAESARTNLTGAP